MTVFESLMVAISFTTLIVSVLALSFTFTQKK
ncbi:putative holin-like toxin [Lysinibacillus sp. NPDC093712]